MQSHLNYCSLVWGFAAKSHIESLFVKQKMGLRAVLLLPGYVNYWYKNALILMHKLKNIPNLVPLSLKKTIPKSAPPPTIIWKTKSILMSKNYLNSANFEVLSLVLLFIFSFCTIEKIKLKVILINLHCILYR